MTVGERIKEIRISKNITLETLANLIGVNRQTIYMYENNIITNIPSDKIEKIAKYFCISPGYLMSQELIFDTDSEKKNK